MNETQKKIILAIVVLGLCTLAFFVVQQQFHNPIIQKHAPQEMPPHEHTEELEASIVQHMQELSKDPKNLHALNALAESFFKLQQWNQAVPFLEKILVQQPDNPPALYMLAFCQTQEKLYTQAEANFIRFTQVSDDPIGYMSLGVLYQTFLKDKQKAIAAYTKVLESPNAPTQMKADAKQALIELQ